MYVLSYQGPKFTNVTVVKVTDKDQGKAYTATLSDEGDCVDVYVNIIEDLAPFSRSVLNTLYNALAPEPVQKFPNQMVARQRLFALLGTVAKEWSPSDAPAPKGAETQPAESSATAVSADSGANPEQLQTEEEANMAAKKKTKVKKTKTPKTPKEKKVSDGLPKAGTKKAELLRLLQREKGATMKEMLEATGWKACLGTAKAVTLAAKQKFRSEKGEGDKPTRWYAE